jgi:membrane protease YdiL (CAAX protease family)
MILQATLIISLLVYQHKLWRTFIPSGRNIFLTIFGVIISSIYNSQIRFGITWITFAEEIFFRGILLQGIENTFENNIISGVIFGIYQTFYIQTFTTFLIFSILGYLLTITVRFLSLYELCIIRTVFTLIIVSNKIIV